MSVNASAMAEARAEFMQGVSWFEAGEWQRAEACFLRALSLVPDRPSVLTNLGITQARLGRPDDALRSLRRSVEVDPAQPDAWMALCLSQHAAGQWADAAESGLQASRQQELPPPVQRVLAECLDRVGRKAEAQTWYEQVLARDPADGDAWCALGSLMRECGQTQRARHCYEQALSHGGDADLCRFYLGALSAADRPPSPPPAYVRGLFDDYAPDFERHLVGALGYSGHTTLVAHIPLPAGARLAYALDLGCGTGLCGPLLRERVQHLHGVDLSPAMIEQARSKGVYDRLEVADVHDSLDALLLQGTRVDLVVAADVFIYVGDLSGLLSRASRLLAPGGWLAFTLELAAGEADFVLERSLRYSHSLGYVRRLAEQSALQVHAVHTAPIRVDQLNELSAAYVVLSKPAAPDVSGAG